MTCAIYARCSTKEQDTSLQVNELRGWARRHDWVIVREYIDEGMSGGRRDRPAFLELMADAEARRFDCVLVYKIDRFGRSLANLVTGIESLENWGVRFVATSQGIDTDKNNPTSRLFLHILGAVAQFEKSLIQERTALGVRRAIAEGKQVGRRFVIFDHERAAKLRADGKSWREISKVLRVPYTTLRRTMTETETDALLSEVPTHPAQDVA